MFEWIESHIIHFLEESAPPIILALMGGVADFLMSDDHSISNMLVGIFLAGFTGYLVLLLCNEWGISQGLTGVTCGISGMSSRVVLQLFKKVVLERIKWYLNPAGKIDKE